MKIYLLDLKAIIQPRTERRLEEWARPQWAVYVARCNNVPVYIGCTSRGVRRRLREHLAKWTPFGSMLDVSPSNEWLLEVQLADGDEQIDMPARERLMIQRYRPQMNRKHSSRWLNWLPPVENKHVWRRAQRRRFMDEWYATPDRGVWRVGWRGENGALVVPPELTILAEYPYCYTSDSQTKWAAPNRGYGRLLPSDPMPAEAQQ